MNTRLTSAATVIAALLYASPGHAETPEVDVGAMIAPVLGQSYFSSGWRRSGLRSDLFVDAKLGRFDATLVGGFWHFSQRFRTSEDDSEFVDPNCVDPIVQGCVGPGNPVPGETQTSVADTAVEVGVQVLDVEWADLRPNLGFVFPTSPASQQRTLIMAARLGLDLELRPIDRLVILLTGRFDKSFHHNITSVVNVGLEEEVRRDPPHGWRTAGSRLPGRESTIVGGVNVPTSVYAGVTPQVLIVSDIWFDLGFGVSRAWSYPIETINFGDAERVASTVTRAKAAIAWRPSWGPVVLDVQLAANTTGPPKTSDNKSQRFPWWHGGDTDASTIELRIAGRFRLLGEDEPTPAGESSR